MPKGKRNTDGGDGDSKDVKRLKSSVGIDGITVRWEWEGDGGKWTSYAPSHNEAITEAFNDDQKEVLLNLGGGVQMRVVLTKMVQKNKKTGWERRLRCCVADAESNSDYYSWEWEDEKGRWNPYPTDTVIKVENCQQQDKKSVGLEAAGRPYTVDTAKMEQRNDVTGVIRKIQRIKAVANQAPEPPVEKEDGGSSAKSGSAAKSGRAAAKSGGAAAANGGSKSGARGKSGAKMEGEGTTTVRTMVMKGKAPIDPECTEKIGKAFVFSEGKDVYDIMLNQTNLQNNNNKYFVIQLLQDDNKKSYNVWFRWGRVGFKGQNNLVPCGPDLDEAKQIFCKKFSDKTKNEFADRKKFKKVPGKYDLVHLDYNAEGADEADSKETDKDIKVPPSKLDTRIQNLVNLICDIKSMEEAVMEMKYDAQKAPLGKLTQEQIKAGYTALKKIDKCITAEDWGAKLVQACDEFYTRIPHSFGMQRPPVLRTKNEVKAKLSLLEALGDIQIAIKMLKEGDKRDNPVDRHYKSLHCELKPLEKKHADFKMIEDYLQNTHARTHNQYKMEIEDVFVCEKEGEKERFQDVGNKMLLWHGSRLTNWAGILAQGLKIAPPEAPVTGYMFGKGLYFADMSSKSANYCFATRAKKSGLVLLSEVALGEPNELLAADYKADDVPDGKQSVKGLGRIAPDPAKNFKMPDGTVVPLGKGVDTGVKNPSGYTLNYNEFIVYNTAQVRMRYLVKVNFNFN